MMIPVKARRFEIAGRGLIEHSEGSAGFYTHFVEKFYCAVYGLPFIIRFDPRTACDDAEHVHAVISGDAPLFSDLFRRYKRIYGCIGMIMGRLGAESAIFGTDARFGIYDPAKIY